MVKLAFKTGNKIFKWMILRKLNSKLKFSYKFIQQKKTSY